MTPRMPSVSCLFKPSCTATSPFAVAWATTAVTITATSLFYAKSSSKTSLEQRQSQTSSRQQLKMDVDLMDRIAAKPYLPVTKTRSVPLRLRLLAIDVPEMRTQGIDGDCRVNMKKVFSDGIAPPKKIQGTDMEVVQKSFAHALVRCRHMDSHRKGVEMVEASVADLNPHNLRRTHQVGSYKYDPGKWTKATTVNARNSSGGEGAANASSWKSGDGEAESDVSEETSQSEEATRNGNTSPATTTTPDVTEQQSKLPTSTNIKKDGTDGGSVLATEEDEYDAPWNQYAWIQELQLRVRSATVTEIFAFTHTSLTSLYFSLD